MATAKRLPQKVRDQIKRKKLPEGGSYPFEPQLDTNRHGDKIIKKRKILHGPKKNKVGYVDTQGRVWIRDRAHAGKPDHWDVQKNDGKDYDKVGDDGELLP